MEAVLQHVWTTEEHRGAIFPPYSEHHTSANLALS